MAMQKVKIHYSGSKAWLVFWFIVFFPVGIVLLATAMDFDLNGTHYAIRYDGSRGWLAFWTLAFFPVAIILGLLNGISVGTEDRALTAV